MARSRGRTAERKKAREQEKRRQRRITIAIGVVVVALVIAAAFFAVNQPAEAPIPEESQTRYDEVDQTVSLDNFPLLGERNAAVQVALYSSFDCPACAAFHDEAMDGLVERVRDADVSLTYVPIFGTGSVPNGQGAAEIALCVGEQDQFWVFQDALYEWQQLFGNQAFTNSRLRTGLNNLGVDMGALNSCRNSSRPGEILADAREDFTGLVNSSGTPTITINGVVPVDENDNPLLGAEAIFEAIDAAVTAVVDEEPDSDTEITVTEEATTEPEPEPTEGVDAAATEEDEETESSPDTDTVDEEAGDEEESAEAEVTEEADAESEPDAEVTEEADAESESDAEATDEPESE